MNGDGQTNRFSSTSVGGNRFMPNEGTIQPIKLSSGSSNRFDAYRSKSNELNSPQGLFNLANQAGLGDKANEMIAKSGGESGKFLSGGAIMDVMDILNIGSYGVVGMVKGKGFMEGIKNRESMSDEDTLGKHGFAGKVAGFFADILLDPLTYIAPWKLIAKVPGVARGAGALKSKMLGELVEIEVDGQKAFRREGGWTPLTMLSDKLVYGFAVDKTYLRGVEKITGKNQEIMGRADSLMKMMSNLTPESLKMTVTKDETGRMISRNITDLEIEMKRAGKDADFELVSQAYKMRDDLMQQLVDLGVISKDSVESHWGTYLKQTYDEFLEAKGTYGKRGIGIDSRGRVSELTEQKMQELGQVEDPAILWGTTLIKQIDLLNKAELQKFTADGYGLTIDNIPEYLAKGGRMEDLHQVSDSSAYTLRGKQVDLNNKLGQINTELGKILKERRKAVGDDKELSHTIKNIQRELSRLKGATEEEIGDALSGMKHLLRESGLSMGPLKKKPTSVGQKAIASAVDKWLKRGSKSDRLARETLSTADLWKEFRTTPEGIALERAFEDPRMMYQWNSPLEFLDAIRYPDKAEVFTEAANRMVDLTDAQQLAKIKKAEQNARRFGELEQTLKVLKETNLELVRDAVTRLEDEYADLLWQKKGILNDIDTYKMGQLAGKFVSKEIWNVLKGTFEPSKEIGQSFVMAFKHAKVIWNPASHVRNAFSASIQNWWEMGLGPWRPDIYYDAIRELKNPNSKVVKEMAELGFNERSGYIQELLDNYMTNKELMKKSIVPQVGGVKAMKTMFNSVDNLMMNSYAHIDNVAKVAAYKYGIKKGLSKEDAYAKAVAATFNYSQVTPFVQQMRRAIWGVPFITFALKAAPLVVRTAAYNPHRISVFGKARNALFEAAGVQGEQEAEAMPDYMRDDMFVMRVPWKDEQGRSMYFDLSYIIPFGSLITGDYLKNPASANPVLQLVKELSTNQTFSGSKIFNETDDISTVTADIFIHVSKLGMPPSVTDFMSDGYASDGTRKPAKMGWDKFARTNTQDLGPNERSFYQETFRMMGIGAVPYDLSSRQAALAYTQKENLSKMLTENGVLKLYESPYLPKDSEFRDEPTIFDREVKPIGR